MEMSRLWFLFFSHGYNISAGIFLDLFDFVLDDGDVAAKSTEKVLVLFPARSRSEWIPLTMFLTMTVQFNIHGNDAAEHRLGETHKRCWTQSENKYRCD